MPVPARAGRPGARRRTTLVATIVVALGMLMMDTAHADTAPAATGRLLGVWEVQSLDGSANNVAHPDWGEANTIYPRAAAATYVDGRSEQPAGPNPRYISNRIFNDTDQHLASARGVSQWGTTWGQFVDHNIALRLGRRQTAGESEAANIPLSQSDPLETYPVDLGILFFGRSAPAEGTGVTNVREQVNQNASYLDAFTTYGRTSDRLDWLREGPVDGNPADNGARLLMTDNYLPRRDARGDASTAPSMVVGGFLTPPRAAVAGDERANENPALLATQTLFAREHNRIVSQLPGWMSEEDKFQTARLVVTAELQYVTYNEFLPSMGVALPRYRGYLPSVASNLTNEFAAAGYRAHSQVRTLFKVAAATGEYTAAERASMQALGIGVTVTGDRTELVIPLGEDAFFNPDLLQTVHLGPLLKALGVGTQAANDGEIENLLRSFPFALPAAENPTCQPDGPPCPRGVNDLGAIDVQRGRDHGLPAYNQARAAYGLPRLTSFTQVTGERTAEFPADPQLTPGAEIDDPDSLDVTALYDARGHRTTAAAGNASRDVRRTTMAARLKAIYGTPDRMDTFVGLMVEKHVPGTEFGPLQLAMWRTQFTALRDGDRFFYGNDPALPLIRDAFGIDYRTSLADIIAANSDIPRSQLADNVFLTSGGDPRAAQRLRSARTETYVPSRTTRRLLPPTGPIGQQPAAVTAGLPLAVMASGRRGGRTGGRRHGAARRRRPDPPSRPQHG